jgi:protease-4
MPPPPLPPPPVIAPPAPGRPRRSRGWMVVSIILFVLLGFCVLALISRSVTRGLNLGHSLRGEAFASAREAGPKLEECYLEHNKSPNKIAVISVDGIISSHDFDSSGNNLVDLIAAQLDRARDDKHVKAVILKVDSPGGEVLASDEIYREICDFEDGTNGKPVICSMGSLAASGGYYISSGCRWIVANELTLTGSIGVIMHGWNYRGLMDKLGVTPMTYKSGKFKDMLSGERATNEIPAGEHEMVQGLINETYEKFKDVVYEGRSAAHDLNKKEGKALAADWEDYADGRVVSGKQALDLGLVDELGNFDDAVDRAEKLAHIRDSNLIEYQEHYDISDLFSMFGQSSRAHDLKLSLGIEPPKLQAGLLYYLAPTFVN